MTNRKQVALFAGAAAVAASVCYLLLSRYRNPREAPKGTLTVRGDSSNIAALRDHFELDKVLWNLKLCFNVRFVEVAPSPTAAPTPTAFELERSTASHSYNAVANALLLGTMEGNLRHRRSVLVPPYIIRWLRWEAQQQQISSALDYPSTPTGALAHGSSFPVEPPAPPLPPKARSGDVLESGAVAGAVPDTRRRRTVEERVMRVALDVLAPLTAGSRLKSVSGQPPTPPRNPPVTPSMSASAPLDESKLPFDTFIADATCAETVIHANIANEYSSRNGASEYVAALLYLMDVAACNGERLPAARRIADETAARIVHQHRGQLESVSRALEPILGSTVEVTSMNHLVQILLTHANTIGSYAINHFGALGGGALAAGSADRTLTNLLDAGQDTVALLAFPMCSLGAFFLLREIYDTVVAHYGSWRMEGFTALNAKLWDRATSKVPPSSWSRLFRSMNRSRTGEISYHEYCSHFAKKVSACGDDFDPDLALVLSLARLRFNHLLFFSRNIEWPGRSFWFDALVDAHDNRE